MQVKKLSKKENVVRNNLDCTVSKASNEIMLDRICVGDYIEFPFSPSVKIK
tara:strand:+ start:145 stop:297 length:153 start_codon:yes stop_codon:yes gene_type:complete